jgi:MSHA biogenesis protein MshN
MSVVNKMLKDLEQRDKQSVYEADYVPVESQGAKSRKLLVGVLVLVVASVAATWLLLPNDIASKSIQANVQVQAPTPPTATILPAAASKADGVNQFQQELTEQQQAQIVLSELDQATLISLENAKQAEAATVVAEAKLAQLNKELEQKVQQVAVKKAGLQQAQQQESTQSASVNNANVADYVEIEPTDTARTEVAQTETKQTETSEPVFNVSSSNKSASTHRMIEQRIQLSLKNGDTASALKDLNNLLALEPRNASARKRLSSLEFAQGNPKRAAFLLDQGIKLSPNDSSMRLMLARLLFRENRNAQALAILNEHPSGVIADNDLLSFRAALAEKQKDYATSLEDYAVLLQRQPGNARWMLGLAISQDKQKMIEQAVITYKKVKSSNQLSAQVVSFVDGRLAALVGS